MRRIVPNVAVEWNWSSGDDLMAFSSALPNDCRRGEIEVLTFELQGNPRDRVAFTINVP